MTALTLSTRPDSLTFDMNDAAGNDAMVGGSMKRVLGLVLLAVLVACGGDGGGSSLLTASKLIGEEGGTIELATGAKVEIPAGALDKPTTITVSEVDAKDIAALPDHMEAAGKPLAFKPHGTNFAQPVKVSIPFEGAATEVRPLKLDDEKDTTWQTVVPSTIDAANSKLNLNTTAFSIYIPARPRSNSGVIVLPDGAIADSDAGMDAGTDAMVGVDASMDACAVNNGDCDPLSSCTNNSGAPPSCGACPVDYIGTGATSCTPTLTALTLSSGALSPTLSSGVTSYSVQVGLGTQTVAFTPTVSAGATASLSPGSEVTTGVWQTPVLNLGVNLLTLTVSRVGQPSRVYSITVTRGMSQQAYVKASNTNLGDQFGYAVALSGDGNTLAVGARYESSAATGIDGDEADNTASGSGAVYVFSRAGGVWSQQAYVKASNAEASDEFGYAIALSGDGDTLAVGAHYEDSAATGIDGDEADNTATNCGAVYVFSRLGAVWSQQAYVKASNAEIYDSFGGAVALSGDGNTLAVGASGEASAATGLDGNQANNTASQGGAVYMFSRVGVVWSQQAYVKASNTATNDFFGIAVALSSDGNTLAVGANAEDSAATGVGGSQADNNAINSGAVYVFGRVNVVWSQEAYLMASNTDVGDGFGGAVALSGDGNTLAVGAYRESSAATGLDGNQADNTAAWSGAVYVFSRATAVWSHDAYVKASNTAANDNFGYAFALSGDGNTLAVGALGEASAATGLEGDQADNSAISSGAVYVFGHSGAVWSQRAYVKASNSGTDDYFGTAVALSGDGNTMAVGAYYEDSAAIGLDGNQADNVGLGSGAVYVFE